MKKITVIKPAKSVDAKPSNYCPWMLDTQEFSGAKK